MENNTNKKNNCPEESSWTFYIQGFMYENDDYRMPSDDQLEESPSLVSDAASSAVKLMNNGHKSNIKLSTIDDDDDDEMNFDECKNNLGFCSGKSHYHHLIPRRSMCRQNSLNCKKQKNTVVTPPVESYDLEDTASSPEKLVHRHLYLQQR